jgi:hypothetical protein
MNLFIRGESRGFARREGSEFICRIKYREEHARIANRSVKGESLGDQRSIRIAASDSTITGGLSLITCYVRYVIDPFKVKEFETYGKMWIPLVEKLGGQHHGYFLPHEGANNIAMALFSFPSFAAYEKYRANLAADPECQAAIRYNEETKCILSYERSFFRPVFSP